MGRTAAAPDLIGERPDGRTETGPRLVYWRNAFQVLLSAHRKQTLPLSGHAELPAIVSHWLQDPANPPVFGDSSMGRKFAQILAKEFGTTRGLTTPRPDIRIDYSATGEFPAVPFPPPSDSRFRFADIFAGIGGFRIALQEAGGACVFSSEWDKAARETYAANYGEVPFGDIRQFTSPAVSDELLDRLVPDHDVLAAGFPCQPFSRAGVSARRSLNQNDGFACETQGTLFFDLLRIVSVKRPKVLLLENVRNLRSHDGGRTFAVIRGAIEELGYSFSTPDRPINSQALVPQRRERCYMVCTAPGEAQYEFPLEAFEGPARPLREALEKRVDPSYTISARLWSGHQDRSARNLRRGTGFTAFEASLDKPANTLVARYGKDGKECLVPQPGTRPRMLTPRECARLQGFPEQFLLPRTRTPAYKQFGNSVVVPVVRVIAKGIAKYFSP